MCPDRSSVYYAPLQASVEDSQGDGSQPRVPRRRDVATRMWPIAKRAYNLVIHATVFGLLVLLFCMHKRQQDLQLHMLPSEFRKICNDHEFST